MMNGGLSSLRVSAYRPSLIDYFDWEFVPGMHHTVLEQFFIKYFFASYFQELIIYSPGPHPLSIGGLAEQLLLREIRFSTSVHVDVGKVGCQ